MASDGKWLFVADSEGSSIRAIPLDGKQEVRTLLGTSQLDGGRLFTFGDIDGPPEKARLQHCLDVAYHDDYVYVADTYNDKIKSIDLKTGDCKTLAGTGKPGHQDTGAAGKPATFFEPTGLTYCAGNLYVADTNNHLIRLVNLTTNRVSTLEITGLTPPPQMASTPAK